MFENTYSIIYLLANLLERLTKTLFDLCFSGDIIDMVLRSFSELFSVYITEISCLLTRTTAIGSMTEALISFIG